MKRRWTGLPAVLAACVLACAFACAPKGTLVPTETAPAGTPALTATAKPTAAPTPTAEPVTAVLYVPAADRKGLTAVEATLSGERPAALLMALVSAGALPDVGYGVNIGFSCGQDTVRIKGERVACVAVRLDVADAFAVAVRGMRPLEARLTLQALADTFLERYDAQAFVLTIAGTELETMYEAYGDAIVRDQWFPVTEN